MNIIKKTAVILLLIITVISCGGKKNISTVTEENLVIEPPVPTRAERVTKALAAAYPEQIKEVEFRNDDWAILMWDTWYYFAGGRMLKEDQLENRDNFTPFMFYGYPAELPPWREPTEEEVERIQNRANVNRNVQRFYSSFLNDLWQAPNYNETERQMVRISFLGKVAQVHKMIHPQTMLAEAQIRLAAQTDPEIQPWINSLNMVSSFGWRTIASSGARSYHSYGLALDFLPVNLRGQQTYWLWTVQGGRTDWYNVSYSERYHPPAAVIKIFEANGFIWGGKWQNFDTMHFEYRPEILYLNEILPMETTTIP